MTDTVRHLDFRLRGNGSDYPHGDPSRQEHMVAEFRERKDLSQTMVEKMLSDNPKRLYGF
jgi:hypothetical protein